MLDTFLWTIALHAVSYSNATFTLHATADFFINMHYDISQHTSGCNACTRNPRSGMYGLNMLLSLLHLPDSTSNCTRYASTFLLMSIACRPKYHVTFTSTLLQIRDGSISPWLLSIPYHICDQKICRIHILSLSFTASLFHVYFHLLTVPSMCSNCL